MLDIVEAQYSLRSHPIHSRDPGLSMPLSLERNFEYATTRIREAIALQNIYNFELMVGDDVSGRVPALLTYYSLLMAKERGMVGSVPATHFMTSGHIGDENRTREKEWRKNLTQHAGQLVGEIGVRQVLIVTEIKSSGKSLRRLKQAFEVYGIEANYIIFGTGHLNGQGSRTPDRQAVGVEKYPPQAVSRRHPEFQAPVTSDLRQYLKEFAATAIEFLYPAAEDTTFAQTPVLPIVDPVDTQL